MALVEKSVLVNYSAERMFHLVDEVERYPAVFSLVRRHPRRGARRRCDPRVDPDRLSRHQAKLQNRESHHSRPSSSRSSSSVARFASWTASGASRRWRRMRAKSISDCTMNSPTACWRSSWGPVFKHIANTLVDAFLRRAQSALRGVSQLKIEVVYGLPLAQDSTPLIVPAGTTVAEAIELSGVKTRHRRDRCEARWSRRLWQASIA